MNDYHILLFETSSPFCSVALLTQSAGTKKLLTNEHHGARDHTQFLLPMADDLLQQAGISRKQLSAVAFSPGPGGFTGLRVACSMAQGIATALDIPVIAVDTMCAIALRGTDTDAAGTHVVLQDARMQEIYAAAYKYTGTDFICIQEPILIAQADILYWLEQKVPIWDSQASGTWQVHGNAMTEFDGLATGLIELGAEIGSEHHGLINCLAQLAEQQWLSEATITAAEAMPLYVRDKVAFTTAERYNGQGGNPKARPVSAPALHKIKPADVAEIASIERQVQEFPWTMRNFKSGLAAGYYGWVARSMGAMSGFALLMDAPDMVHLLVLAVHPQDQHRGIGQLLVNQCITHCRQIKAEVLSLEVRKSNTQAINFYQKMGFEQVGVRVNYYPTTNGREDGLIMSLNID